MDVPMGASLVKACRPAARADRHSAVELEAALSSVLEGAAIDGVIEQRSDGGPEAECWSTTVAPLNRPEGGAVLIRTDLTGLRRAEMDAQRSHQALAHVGRVSTVGELTASLAHQLSQPLTAILANAQAARRIMEAPAPDYLTVKAILADIVADDRRATDVIQHLRDFLRKGGTRAIRVSLPEIIVDVVRLLGSEAIIRNVSVQVQTGPGSHFVRGDRIQLQQVVLNLLHNAMDALGSGDRPRRITIECGTGDRGEVVLKVCDTGVGIEPGAEELVFDPFYTTKREGMGMGLSIVRSIVIAHGGAIRVTRSSDYSTIFEVTLPADRPVAEPRLAMRA
jgi:C4-dicarboxylate-specific signal transduction histidine kinase